MLNNISIMYILIPTLFIVISVLGVLYIFLKKVSYLKKLSTDEGQLNYSFWGELFPEIFSYFKKIDLATHKQAWMKEFEKFLRRLHIVSLKLDNFTNFLLHKIRTKNGALKNEIKNVEFEDKKELEKVIVKNSLEMLKKEEQRLIVEIARDPKNIEFYKSLGDVYIQMNNYKDAKESFLVALELNLNDQELKLKLDKISKHLNSSGL